MAEKLELVSIKDLKVDIHASYFKNQNLKQTDIIFMQPLSRLDTHRFSRGILLISSYLDENGIPSIIFEPHRLLVKPMKWHAPTPEQTQEVEDRFLEKVKAWDSKIFCFTCTTMEFNEVIDFAKKIKQILPNAIFVAGGYHADAFPEDFLNNGFDYAVRGEGELTIMELFRSIFAGKRDFEKMDGLCWKKEDGQVVINKRRSLLIDFDELPLPAYHKIDMEYYLKMWDGILRGIPCKATLLETSRGCPWACSFCSCPTIAGHKMRYRTAESIESEVKLLKEKYGVEGIMLTDDMFTVSLDHVKKVSAILKKYGIVWTAQARVHAVNEEMLTIMKDAGCMQIDFGIESGSQRVLNEIINKKATIEQARQGVATCKKVGMRTMGTCMLGLPTETKDEMLSTVAFVKELQLDYVYYAIAVPLPNTALFEMVNSRLPENNKITVEDYRNLDWGGKNYSNKFNFSAVDNLTEIHKIFEKELHRNLIKNAMTNNTFYMRMFASMPNKTGRMVYMAKKGFNFFVVQKLYGKSLRL